MDMPRDNKEHVYYDLQELTFVPGMSDESYAWVDKVLTLGHPEDWAEGIDYTDHVYNTTSRLLLAHVTHATGVLYNEYRDYQREQEEPRQTERQHTHFDVAQAEQQMTEMEARRALVTTYMVEQARRYAVESGLWGYAGVSHYSLPGDRLQYVDETEEVPRIRGRDVRDVNISELAESGRWNWWGEGEDE